MKSFKTKQENVRGGKETEDEEKEEIQKEKGEEKVMEK